MELKPDSSGSILIKSVTLQHSIIQILQVLVISRQIVPSYYRFLCYSFETMFCYGPTYLRPYFENSFKTISLCLLISACSYKSQNNAGSPLSEQVRSEESINENDVPVAETTTNIVIDRIINSGKLEFNASVGQVIVVNRAVDNIRWNAILGRHDFESAVFSLFENKLQHSLSFKAPGSYKIALSSIQSIDASDASRVNSTQPNTMQISLTAIVK